MAGILRTTDHLGATAILGTVITRTTIAGITMHLPPGLARKIHIHIGEAVAATTVWLPSCVWLRIRARSPAHRF